MDTERIQDILEGEAPQPGELAAMLREYPYWVTPMLLALEEDEMPEGVDRKQLRMKVAASVGDPGVLDALIGADEEMVGDFYGDAGPVSLSTDDAIDRFIDKFGGATSKETPEEVPIAAPAIDYATMLENEEEETTPEETEAVDVEEDGDEVWSGDSEPALTESLALLMIKNHNYVKALEIISALNLNNPEKSAYFADQMRFLRKLILNEQKK